MKTEIAVVAVVKDYNPGMDLGIAVARGIKVNFSITAHCALVAGNGTPTFGEFDGNAKPEKGVHIVFVMEPGGDFVEKWARFVDWKFFTRKPVHLDRSSDNKTIGPLHLHATPESADFQYPPHITSGYAKKRWRQRMASIATK